MTFRAISPLLNTNMQKRQIDEIIYRDHRCVTYQKCLDNAARFDLILDCSDCPNKRYKIPKPDDGHTQMILEDAMNCSRLLRAIFFPEEWRYEHPVTRVVEPEPDAPLADVEYVG